MSLIDLWNDMQTFDLDEVDVDPIVVDRYDCEYCNTTHKNLPFKSYHGLFFAICENTGYPIVPIEPCPKQ